MADEVEEFAAAGTAFVAMLAAVPADGWEAPGLGEWSVRSLAGHAARALVTVIEGVRSPAGARDREAPLDYYLAVLTVPSLPDLNAQVARRGVEAGLELGDDPVATAQGLLDEALAAVRATELDALVTTRAGGMRLRDYLPTRTFELVVHSLDLADALERELQVRTGPLPAEPVRACLVLAADIAIATDQAAPLLRALTGRRTLPAGFRIVP